MIHKEPEDRWDVPLSKKCLITGCDRPAALALKRGMCMVCYKKAKKIVEAGITTWAEIVDLGLAIQSDGEDTDPFTKAFNSAKKRT